MSDTTSKLATALENQVFNVTFNANGGNIISIDNISNSSKIEIPLIDIDGNSLFTYSSQEYCPVFLSAYSVPTLTKTVQYGESIGELPIAVKNYWKFIGWFTSLTGGTKITENTVIKSNVTYYARYESRFYVYSNNKWNCGELYRYSNNKWSCVTPVINTNNKWN